MPDKTEDIRKMVEERLAELDTERKRLLKALAALGAGRPSGRTRGSGGTNGNSASTRQARRPGRRRRKGGTRAEHAEKAVADNPGITASAIAEQLKIKPNYVYRVMAELVKEGRVAKKGTGYVPAEASAE